MTVRKGATTKEQNFKLKKEIVKVKKTLRKQKVKDEFAPKKSVLDKALEYFSLGFDSYQISAMLDISEEQLDKWCKNYPKLETAKKKKTLLYDAACKKAILDLALGKCKVEIEETLLNTNGQVQYKRMTKQSVKPDLNACKEWLENNENNTDKKDMHVTISFDGEQYE